MDRWVGGRKFKLPRSKSPFNEKTIFVETERAARERETKEGFQIHTRAFVRPLASANGKSKHFKDFPPPFSPALPSERIHCRRELLLNLICYKTILSTALGIWAKNCPGILSLLRSVCPRDPSLVLSSCPETDLGISLLLLCGDWSPGSAAAASGSGGGRICKGFTSDLEGLRLIAS